MKNKASLFLKRSISVLSSIAKAKSMAIRNKTSAAKARLIMFSLLKNKKLIMASVSHKLHRLLGTHDKENEDEGGDESKAIVLYNAMTHDSHASSISSHTRMVEKSEADEDDDNDKYPDLRHSLFDQDDIDFEDPGGSVIDLVRNSKEEGENFSLEDEIDHVADLFILRFHKQMRLQKLDSFKRYQDMLERSL